MAPSNPRDQPHYMANDDQEDEDYEEGFEEGADDGVDEIERLKLAMAKEKAKAKKYNQNSNSLLGSAAKQRENPLTKKQPFEKATGQSANLEGFSKQKGLLVGERVDHVAANRQVVRAKELREIIQLSEEEHFSMFELVPQSQQDIYFNKLQSGSIKTAIVSTTDDNIDREIQTEDLGLSDKFN